MLSVGAFNAMLKTLEEPPPHTIFILATTEIHKVPITILSRCQRYDFRRINHSTICEHISKIAYTEGFSITDEAISLIAKLGDGSMRDAISLLDRCLVSSDKITYDNALFSLSIPENFQITSLWNSIVSCNVSDCLSHFASAYNDGRDIISLFDGLLSLIRDIYITKAVSDTSDIPFSSSFTGKEIKDLGESVSPNLLDYFIETINNTLSKLTRTSVRRMDAEVCLIKLCTRPSENVVYVEKSNNPPAPIPNVVAKKEQPVLDTDAPPFDMPSKPEKASILDIPEIKTSAKPIKKVSEESSGIKKAFLKALMGSVNVATMEFLKRCDIEQKGEAVIIVATSDDLPLLQRKSVTDALTKGATLINLTSALVTDVPFKQEEKSPKTKRGLEELSKRAQDLGLIDKN